MKWVARETIQAQILAGLRDAPVTMLTGPRQCGKTSIARRIAALRRGTYFDLEDPQTPIQSGVAHTVLGDLKGLVVLDEIQRQPALFELLRVLADRRPRLARFLLLGSASPDLIRGAGESLAGRVRHVDMEGLGLGEVGAASWKRLWVRGGFPASYLAAGDARSMRWRMDFIQSLLERDIPQLGIRVPAAALRRFWMMLAHFHGQVWNGSELGQAMGVKPDTARRYLDILCGAFMVRTLPPWFENVGKRLVKAPKIYFRDSGLLHALLGLEDVQQALSHPRLGFSWEGFALDEVLRATGGAQSAYFYRTYAGAELDLLIFRRDRRYGFEFKFGDAPRPTRGMHAVIKDLGLEKLWIIYNGDEAHRVADRVWLLPLAHISRGIEW